jgi:hypothetical protein
VNLSHFTKLYPLSQQFIKTYKQEGSRANQEFRNIFRYFLVYSLMKVHKWDLVSSFDCDVLVMKHMDVSLMKPGCDMMVPFGYGAGRSPKEIAGPIWAGTGIYTPKSLEAFLRYSISYFDPQYAATPTANVLVTDMTIFSAFARCNVNKTISMFKLVEPPPCSWGLNICNLEHFDRFGSYNDLPNLKYHVSTRTASSDKGPTYSLHFQGMRKGMLTRVFEGDVKKIADDHDED